MATTEKILAQSKPGATTLTDAYTAKFINSAERARFTSLDLSSDVYRDQLQGGALIRGFIACNQAGSASVIRVSIAIAGAADATSQYIYYGVSLAANTTLEVDFASPIPLLATDVFRVYSDTGSVSFTLWGQERGL